MLASRAAAVAAADKGGARKREVVVVDGAAEVVVPVMLPVLGWAVDAPLDAWSAAAAGA